MTTPDLLGRLFELAQVLGALATVLEALRR